MFIGIEILQDPGQKDKNAGRLYLRRVNNPGEYLSCIATWNRKWNWWSPNTVPIFENACDLMIDYEVLVPR